MKFLKDLCKMKPEEGSKLCEYVSTPKGPVKLDQPILSNEKKCEWCGGFEHKCPHVEPSKSDARTWLCINPVCVVTKDFKTLGSYVPTTHTIRSVSWSKFCEFNGIGDVHHEVKFDKMQQSDAKKSFLLKFASLPRGIVLMQGDPGTGKTYAAMAICEFYTRSDSSAIFITQKQMLNNWLQEIRGDTASNFVYKITNVNLLVIDDFGTADPTPGFLSFFMDLINTRIQWKNRGTVITTNLSTTKFNEFCGEALSDRLRTGTLLKFEGKTRRKSFLI